MIITIDGPSGTGKSTVAKKVAERLGYTFFDTGAMYRSVAWALDQGGISIDDREGLSNCLKAFTFDIRIQDGMPHYFVDGVDVTQEIRSQKITERVSEVSAKREVREIIWRLQREYAKKTSSVFEGRDMGSFVFPNAELKVYLDAKPDVRAKRRLQEMREKHPMDGAAFDEEKMQQELMRRDQYDSSREIAPLKVPKKAFKVDTSNLSIDEVVETILKRFHKQVLKLLPTFLNAEPMGILYRFIIALAWMTFRCLYRHRVFGLEHFIRRAAIIAPNHTSYLDPPLASVSWPLEVHFLAKEELFRPFLFGRFIRALNSHPVSGDVGDVGVFKTILSLLKEGKQLILFPEGARTDGEIGEIKPGIGMLMMRSQSAIIPTYIHGAKDAFGRGRKLPKLRGKTATVFGRPILWENFSHLERKQAQLEIAKCLSTALHNLRNWYESGADGIPP